MIEQGIVKLVQGAAAVAAIATSGGGFLLQLPDGHALPSWTYFVVSEPDEYTYEGLHGFVEMRLQIDVYGTTGAESYRLAKAIDGVLSGYSGTLDDVDQTKVSGCFRLNKEDRFDDAAGTFRRILEYQVFYTQS